MVFEITIWNVKTGTKNVRSGLFVIAGAKANLPARRNRGWLHELTNSIEHNLELCIVLVFHLREFPGQVLVSRHQLPELHKSPHDQDVDLDSTLAAQNT